MTTVYKWLALAILPASLQAAPVVTINVVGPTHYEDGAKLPASEIAYYEVCFLDRRGACRVRSYFDGSRQEFMPEWVQGFKARTMATNGKLSRWSVDFPIGTPMAPTGACFEQRETEK